MNYIPITVVAYLFNGVALLVDKFLITKKIPDPLIYIFYWSIFSFVLLFLIPFVNIPTLSVFFLASSSTILWTLGAYFMLKALRIGQAARIVPIIGTLVPIFLLVEGVLNARLLRKEVLGVVILILGMVAIIAPNTFGELKAQRKEIFFKELPLGILSAFLFAISYLILKSAYEQSNFITVLAYSRLILIPVGVFLVLLPKTRGIIWPKQKDSRGKYYPGGFNFFSKAGLLFLGGQASGVIAEILLTFSISLAKPALVNSLQGLTYVFIFLASLILSKTYPSVFKESFRFFNIAFKSLGVSLIFAGLYILAFLEKV